MASVASDGTSVVVRGQPFLAPTAVETATLSAPGRVANITWSTDEQYLILDIYDDREPCLNSMHVMPLDGSRSAVKVREVARGGGLQPEWLPQFWQTERPDATLKVTAASGRAQSPNGRFLILKYRDQRGSNCIEFPILGVWNLETMSPADCMERPQDCAGADEKVSVNEAFEWPRSNRARNEMHLYYDVVGWLAEDHALLQIESSFGRGFADLKRTSNGVWKLSAIRPQLDPPVRVERAKLAKVTQPFGTGWRFEYTSGRLDRIATTGTARGTRIALIEGQHFALQKVRWSPGALDIDRDGVPDRSDSCIGSNDDDCDTNDVDGDGQTPAGGDCNDMLPSVHIGWDEHCNDMTDSDCDGRSPPSCVDTPVLPAFCAAISAMPVTTQPAEQSRHAFQQKERRPCWGWVDQMQGARILHYEVGARFEFEQPASSNEEFELVSYRVDRAGGQPTLLFPHSTRADHFVLSRRDPGIHDFRYSVDFTTTCDLVDDTTRADAQTHQICIEGGAQLGANEVVMLRAGITTNNTINSDATFRLHPAETWIQYTYETAHETVQTPKQYLAPP